LPHIHKNWILTTAPLSLEGDSSQSLPNKNSLDQYLDSSLWDPEPCQPKNLLLPAPSSFFNIFMNILKDHKLDPLKVLIGRIFSVFMTSTTISTI
jgi:hypothetical protein